MANTLLHERVGSPSCADAEPRVRSADTGEPYLRAMLDACASGAALLDETGTVLYVNGAWRRLAAKHGLEHELYGVGLNYVEICGRVAGASAEEGAAIAEGVGRVLAGGEAEFQKECVRHRSAARRCLLVHAVRLDVPDTFRVLVTHEDTALNHWTSEAERKHEERLRLLLEMTNILPWEAEVETGLFTYVGEQAVKMLGYPTELWYEPDFWVSHIHPEDRERVVADRRKYSKARDNYELEYRMTARDGRVVWLQDMVSVVHESESHITARGFLIDITEHKKTEEALISLSGRLINAREEERKRIARELHDDLNQRMALLSIELEQLGQAIQKPHGLRPLVHNLQTKAKEISAEIHRLSYRLHPSKLDHLGLVAAVASLCEELAEGRGLKIEFQQRGFPVAVPKDVSLCIFRIAQESLRNCVRHSGARRARVVLDKAKAILRLTVSDDGCGFDTESGAMKKGLGFTSIRERLRLVGGDAVIYSRPGAGTRIVVSVPLAGGDGVEPGEGNELGEDTSQLLGERL